MAPKQDPRPKFQEGEDAYEQEHNPCVKTCEGCVRPWTTEKRILRDSGGEISAVEFQERTSTVKIIRKLCSSMDFREKAFTACLICGINIGSFSLPPDLLKSLFYSCERVLCFHGPLLYEAKCVKVAVKDKQVKYFIHYSGWNKNWDEWVPESRVLKYVDTNLQKQKELQKANQDQYAEGKMRAAAPGKKSAALQQKNVEVKTKKNKQKAPGSGEGTSTSDAPQPPRKKRARVDPTVESEETFMNRVEVKVKIPEELKPWLVDDWDLITRQKQLFNLPAKKSVETILEEYATYKKSRGNTDNKEFAVNEVVAGIKEYFNVMLGTQLLYKFERPQYADILADHPDSPMSQVYGAPHLLRLFVRIGAMLSYTPLDEKSLALLLNYLHDFLKYLAKNSSTLFSASDYEVAPPEYHRKAV